MKSLYQLEIPKRNAHCSHKGEPLSPGMEIFSLLQEQEDRQFARNDYCACCWGEIHRALCSKTESRGYWKSKIESRKPVPEPTRAIRALKLLKELLLQPENHHEEIFVLSLFLAHARVIALRQEFQLEGVPLQLYEVLRQEEFITIKMVNLSLIQIEAIQKLLASKLSSQPN